MTVDDLYRDVEARMLADKEAAQLRYVWQVSKKPLIIHLKRQIEDLLEDRCDDIVDKKEALLWPRQSIH